MLGYLGVSFIYYILTLNTGFLTCVCDLFACVCTHVKSHLKDFCRDCTEFYFGEILRWPQSLEHNKQPVLVVTTLDHAYMGFLRASALTLCH